MAHLMQPRRQNGEYGEVFNPYEGLNAPRTLGVPPVSLPDRFSNTPVTGETAHGAQTPPAFEALSPMEARRYAKALIHAMRTPTTPADRAAVSLERAQIEARFGQPIAWAA
jgi:hypothetical protein